MRRVSANRRCCCRALLLALGWTPFAAATPAGPESQVREAIERYFRADALGSAEQMREVFAPGAMVRDKRGSTWVRLTPEALAAQSTGAAADESQRVRRVESLRVHGGEASVVISRETPTERRRERLVLQPRGGVWRIVVDRREVTPKPPAASQRRTLEAELMKPIKPFRLLGNLHYVGARGISAFLLTTPAGHVLLDTGPAEMLPMLERNVEALGAHLADVKLLLNSHAHYDHCGGFAELRRRTGARILASEADAAQMERGGRGDFAYGDDYPFEPFTPDQRIPRGCTRRPGTVSKPLTGARTATRRGARPPARRSGQREPDARVESGRRPGPRRGALERPEDVDR